jgi:uncharacterized protein
MQFKLSRYIHIVEDKNVLPDSAIVYGTRRGLAFELPLEQLRCLKEGEFSALPFDSFKKLIQSSIIVPVEENELHAVLEENKAGVKDLEYLGFTIQPTANCQLGCHYCGQVHSKKVMSVKIADLMIERIRKKIEENRSRVKALNITWYGGEPLTGLSSIEYSSFILQDLAKEAGLKYNANMVTNGLALKEKLFQHLAEDHKINRFQITLDGTAEFHDKRRMLKNGTASFDIIFNNICRIVHSDFYSQGKARISIRCNVNAENKDNVFSLMDLMKEHGIHDKVTFALARVTDWGDNDAGTEHNGGISKEDFARLEIDVMLKQITENFKYSPAGLIPQRLFSACMATTETSEVFDGFGNVSTCWEVPYTPVFDNDRFVAGNLAKNDSVDSSNTAMRKWFDEIPTNETWCKNCRFLPVCGGSCPKEWYQGTPACPSFKFNIDERLLMKKFKIA